MSGTAVRPEGFAVHPSFSPAITVTGGTTIYVAGQLPLSSTGELVHAGDIDAQIDKVWDQIERILVAAGATVHDIVKVIAYTTDVAYVAKIVEARRIRFEGVTPPASALVVVKDLALPGSLVEIEGIAVI